MPDDKRDIERIKDVLEMIVENQQNSNVQKFDHVILQVDKLVSSIEKIDLVKLSQNVKVATERATTALDSANKAHSRVDAIRNFGSVGAVIATVIAYFLGEKG